MRSVPPNKPDLDEYRAKRSADSTPEPMGDSTDARKRLFVLHKHNASRLHWDLRLEWEGVLLSWAVPKGPSHDPPFRPSPTRSSTPTSRGSFRREITARAR